MREHPQDFNLIPQDTILLKEDGSIVSISRSLTDFFQERCIDLPDSQGLMGTSYLSLWENVLNESPDKERFLEDVKRLLSKQIRNLVIDLQGCNQIGMATIFLHRLDLLDIKGYILIQHIDITRFVKTEHRHLALVQSKGQELLNLVYKDPTTQLPNRFVLIDRLNELITRAKRYRSKFAVMFVDIDNFKKINESLGHEAGDILLKESSKRLKDALRDSDIIARFGGDEFAIVLYELEKLENTATVAQRIINSISDPFYIKEQDIYVTVSVGIATYPEDGDNTETLLRNTETAMFYAKSLDKNNYQFFNKMMNQHAFERLKLENDIRRAIENDEFILHYQPQIALPSGKIVGVEGLLRWFHPNMGSISPLKFIPIAEETGLIIPLSELVFKKAVEQLSKWLQSGFTPGVLAVNVSFKHFRQKNFSDFILEVLERNDVDPSLIELELTESILMHDVQSVVATLQRLRERGIQISIDDFGTGYSSLNYLKNL
ncbi:MAG: diguanylate cyclase, partial [Thermodesulfovibrionales bacterium]